MLGWHARAEGQGDGALISSHPFTGFPLGSAAFLDSGPRERERGERETTGYEPPTCWAGMRARAEGQG